MMTDLPYLTDFENNFVNLKNQYYGSYSLYNGKIGLCMASFLRFNQTNQKYWENEALTLLEDVCDNIGKVQQLDFSIGLAGIGWSIEWIVQNKFVDANTDDILESLDDELYKAVLYQKDESLALESGTIGKALFFYRRLMAENPNSSHYRKICNRECLILLIDKIYQSCSDQEGNILTNPKDEDVKIISQCLLFSSQILNARIGYGKTKEIIKAIYGFIINTSKFQSDNSIYRPLWQAYLIVSEKLNYRKHKDIASFMLNSQTQIQKARPEDCDNIYSLLVMLSKEKMTLEPVNWREAWLYL